ncbi:DNA mismatch repair protein [Coemansia sp. BCRC 34962]|nr:DNA mismatch repair protein [Coemansia sp. BCRC 34962]
MSNVGIVEVISRKAKSGSARRCAIENERQLCCEDCDSEALAGYSTIVKVRDIFGAYPVRRKLIDSSRKKVLDDIKAQLQARTLGHPRIALQLVTKPGDTVVFAYASASSLNQRMLQVFGPAVALGMESLSLDYDGYCLLGSFSKAPMLCRAQHIFVDGRLVDPPELLVVARAVFAGSNYATRANVAVDAESAARLRTRHPVFVLAIRSSEATEQVRVSVPRGCFVQLLHTRPDKRASDYSGDESKSCPIPFAGIGSARLEMAHVSGKNDLYEGLDVASLRVVGQADQKFIICQTSGWLVGIDQHAADERIRLEEYYNSLNDALCQCARLAPNCSPSVADGVSVLVPPVPVLLTEHDMDAILGMTGRFKRLGIQIVSPALEICDSPISLLIVCAPTVLLPRLRDGSERAGQFAKDLLLSIAGWHVGPCHTPTESPPHQTAVPYGPAESGSSSGWPALVDLPGVILEALKDIACRGAVRFGDPLSAAECQSIVARLASCQFPEFCAHGRQALNSTNRSPGLMRAYQGKRLAMPSAPPNSS